MNSKQSSLRKELEVVVAHTRLNAVLFTGSDKESDENIAYETNAILDSVIAALPPEHEGTSEYDNAQEVGESMGWDAYRDEVKAILEAAKKDK